jgi:RNA polymerase sigma factor (sigma-70 family)
MKLLEDVSTSPTLLSEVRDWGNYPAWVAFRDRYDPLLRRWCRGFGLDADSIDEACQRIWTELADRMRTFRYDPNRTFRGWLRCVCRCRVIDLLRERRADHAVSLDDRDDERSIDDRGTDFTIVEMEHGQVDTDPVHLFLRSEAEQVQAAVRRRIQPRTWDAFWLVAVSDWTIDQTAKALGMTRIAVYAATQRVSQMLREEGLRRSNRWQTIE